MEKRIIDRLEQDRPFTKRQIEYIQEWYLPQFECDCGLCRFNLAVSLGYTVEELLG